MGLRVRRAGSTYLGKGEFMSFIERNMLPGEHVVAAAKLHWAMFIAPALVMLIGLTAMGGEDGTSIFMVLGLIWLVWRFIIYVTTEMAVTNKRVLAKTGVIRRNFVDLHNSKVEGVTYHQGIIGRFFGYGSIAVRGTGIGIVPVPYISQPEAFKRELSTVISGG